MIKYYSTLKSLYAHYDCELSFDYEDKESYCFKVISKMETTTKGKEETL